MSDDIPMVMTEIELRSADLKSLIAKPPILWPPEIIPDVLHIGVHVFVRCGTNMVDKPTYRRATCMAITNIDL